MAPKRRHEGDDAPAKMHRGTASADASDASTRKSILKAHIMGLNSQFASWVSAQNVARPAEVWIEGAKDYLQYVQDLMEEYEDVIPRASGAPPASSALSLGNGNGQTRMSDAPSATTPSLSFLAPTAVTEPTTTQGGSFGQDAAPGFGSGGAKRGSNGTAAAAAAAGEGVFGFGTGGAGKGEKGGTKTRPFAIAQKAPGTFASSDAEPSDAAADRDAAEAPAAKRPAVAFGSAAAAGSDGSDKPGTRAFGFAGGSDAEPFKPAASSNAGASQPPAALTFGGSTSTTPAAVASTDVAASTKPSGLFTFGSAAATTDADASAKPPAAFTFGGAATSTDADDSARPPAAFTFGGAAATTTNAAASAKPPAAFTFGGAATTTNADASAKPPAAFTFGGASAAADQSTTSATTGLFSFGKPTNPAGSGGGDAALAPEGTNGAAAAAKPPLFSFGGSAASGNGASAAAGTTAASSSTPLFSFGAPPASFGAAPGAAAGGGEEAEGEEEAPQKFESAVTVSEESGTVIFKAKSKFHHLIKDGGKQTWEGKGIGTFMLRTRNDESKKPFVTFTTEAGRVLYIANIPKNMQTILVDAKNGVSFSAPWSPDGTSPPTPQGVMFVFPKGLNATFKTELEKLQAAMPS